MGWKGIWKIRSRVLELTSRERAMRARWQRSKGDGDGDGDEGADDDRDGQWRGLVAARASAIESCGQTRKNKETRSERASM